MMKLGFVLALVGTPVSSFVTAPCRNKAPAVLFAVDDALPDLWDDLKHEERDLVVQSVIEGKDLDVVTKTLVEKLLEAALEHVKTKEHLEQEHVESARQHFDHALEEEHKLEELALEDQLMDVPMDSFLEGRWQAAQLEEQQAMEDDQQAIDKFDELKNAEEDIKVTLNALKKLEP